MIKINGHEFVIFNSTANYHQCLKCNIIIFGLTVISNINKNFYQYEGKYTNIDQMPCSEYIIKKIILSQ